MIALVLKVFAIALAAFGVVWGTAGCGASDPTTAANTKANRCERVVLGKDSQGIAAYAEVVMPIGVDCATAQLVVAQWGRQQIGKGAAKLPPGWKCDASAQSPACRKGNASVGLTLVYPSN